MDFVILKTLYVLALLSQIILLLLAWKKQSLLLWLGLHAFEILSTVTALGVMQYYNEHPGYMLSTMGHVLISMLYAGIFFVMLLITVPTCIVRTFAH